MSHFCQRPYLPSALAISNLVVMRHDSWGRSYSFFFEPCRSYSWAAVLLPFYVSTFDQHFTLFIMQFCAIHIINFSK
jgi:hypothetical protein